MDLFEFVINYITLAVQAALHILFSFHFSEKKWRLLPLCLYFLMLCIIQATAFALALPLSLIALYGINRFVLKNGHSISCIVAVLAVYITQLSFGLVNSIETLVFPAFIENQILVNLLISFATILAFLLCWLFYRQIEMQFKIGSDYPCAWLLLPPCLFFLLTEFYVLQTTYQQTTLEIETGLQIALFTLQALGFAALFSTLLVYQRVRDGFQAKSTLALLKQEIHAQETYVTQAQTRYEQTRAFRHDLKNHLSVLNGLIKSENREQAQCYLDKLDNATQELSFPIQTGNPIIDVLLSDKLELAKGAGIECEASLSIPQSSIDAFDLCVIFGNAMDNAIAACRVFGGDKLIRVVDKQQGDFYMIEFENTCTAGSQRPMGIGLSNVKAVAEKNGGTIIIEKTQSHFRLNVLLNISLQP